MKKSLLMLVLVSGLFIGQPLDACLMHDLSLDPQHRAYANESVGGLFTQTASEIWSLTGGVKIHDNWVITAAHIIDNTGEPYGIYFGENAWSPIQSSLVDAYYVHPDWNGVNSHDLVLLHLSNPLTEIPTATITDYQPTVGQHLQFTGYGLYGTEYNPIDVQDGYRRGWEGELTRFGDPGKVPTYYLTSDWTNPYYSDSYPLGGLGAYYDSGGGVFDDEGYLVGIITGVSCANCNHYSVDTYAIGLWEEDVQNWITETTGVSAVPIPGALWLFGTGFIGFAVYRRKMNA